MSLYAVLLPAVFATDPGLSSVPILPHPAFPAGMVYITDSADPESASQIPNALCSRYLDGHLCSHPLAHPSTAWRPELITELGLDTIRFVNGRVVLGAEASERCPFTDCRFNSAGFTFLTTSGSGQPVTLRVDVSRSRLGLRRDLFFQSTSSGLVVCPSHLKKFQLKAEYKYLANFEIPRKFLLRETLDGCEPLFDDSEDADVVLGGSESLNDVRFRKTETGVQLIICIPTAYPAIFPGEAMMRGFEKAGPSSWSSLFDGEYRYDYRMNVKSLNSDHVATSAVILLDTGSSKNWLKADKLPTSLCTPRVTDVSFKAKYADTSCYEGFCRVVCDSERISTVNLEASIDGAEYKLTLDSLAIVTKADARDHASMYLDGLFGLSPNSEIMHKHKVAGFGYTNKYLGWLDLGKSRVSERCGAGAQVIRFPMVRGNDHWVSRGDIELLVGGRRQTLMHGAAVLWDTGWERMSASKPIEESISGVIEGNNPCPPEDARLIVRSPMGGSLSISLLDVVYVPPKCRIPVRPFAASEPHLDLSLGASVLKRLYVVFDVDPLQVSVCVPPAQEGVYVIPDTPRSLAAQLTPLIAGSRFGDPLFPIMVDNQLVQFKLDFLSSAVSLGSTETVAEIHLGDKQWKQKVLASPGRNSLGLAPDSSFLFNAGAHSAKFSLTGKGLVRVAFNEDAAGCVHLPVEVGQSLWEISAEISVKIFARNKLSIKGHLHQQNVLWAPTGYSMMGTDFFEDHIRELYAGNSCPGPKDVLVVSEGVEVPLGIFVRQGILGCTWEHAAIEPTALVIGRRHLKSAQIILKPRTYEQDAVVSICN